jgi:hypothetical protein
MDGMNRPLRRLQNHQYRLGLSIHLVAARIFVGVLLLDLLQSLINRQELFLESLGLDVQCPLIDIARSRGIVTRPLMMIVMVASLERLMRSVFIVGMILRMMVSRTVYIVLPTTGV